MPDTSIERPSRLPCPLSYSPTMQWVIQQLRNAMPFDEKPRFLREFIEEY